MKKYIFNLPINKTSLGNVSVCLLKEAYEAGDSPLIFPIGGTDISVFNLDEDFTAWLQDRVSSALKEVKHDMPSLKHYHLSGGFQKFGGKQVLFTPHELYDATDQEVESCFAQSSTVFTSSHSASVFQNAGVENATFANLGFDKELNAGFPRKKGGVHFSLIGKAEKRKNTIQIIKNWIELFGNDYDYHLSCLINNLFLPKEKLDEMMQEATGGKHYGNISFLPFLGDNNSLSDFMHSIDIDLSGLSNGEGWNLPSFNMTALGTWSVIANHTAHLDWADSDNAILVEPEKELQSAVDNVFFFEDQPFNCGRYCKISDEAMKEGMERAVNTFNDRSVNEAGKLLQKKFTYENTYKTLTNLL